MKWRDIETDPPPMNNDLPMKKRPRLLGETVNGVVKMVHWLDPSDGWAVYGWKCPNGRTHNIRRWAPIEPPGTSTEEKLEAEVIRLREALKAILFENSDKPEADRLKDRIRARTLLGE